MSQRNDGMVDAFDRYVEEVNEDPVSLDEVADWVLRERLFSPGPRDLKKLCKDALAEGLRSHKRFDGTRWYRAKHSVRTNIGGVQLSLWADIDKNASRSFMEKSLAQRRRNAVHGCFQMKMDADHYNEANPNQDPIQLILDFTDDVAELEATMGLDDSDGQAA